MAQRLSVTVQVSETVNRLMELQKKAEKFALSLAADIGASGRLRIYPKYLSSPYSMRRGQTRQRDLANPKWAQKRGVPFRWSDATGRLDKLGRRGVAFSLENKRPSLKVAYFSAFMNNGYENDVKLGGWAKGITRKGTHLMRDYFPKELEGVVPGAVDRFNAKLEKAIAEAGMR